MKKQVKLLDTSGKNEFVALVTGNTKSKKKSKSGQKVNRSWSKICKKDILKSARIEVMVMNLGEKENLEYLFRKGFKISRQYYHKLKKQIKESRLFYFTGFI
jgi:regulator of replication initiation timing